MSLKEKFDFKSFIVSLISLAVLLIIFIFVLLITNSKKNTKDIITYNYEKPHKNEEIAGSLSSNVFSDDNLVSSNSSSSYCSDDKTSSTVISETYNIPDSLLNFLNKSTYTIDDLRDIEQLILVESYGDRCTVYLFEKSNKTWLEPSYIFYGRVGKNGVSDTSQEGDYKTPYGLYSIGEAFFIDDIIKNTKLDYFIITDKTYWVDDANSVYYNMRVEGTDNKDWNSAEHMIEYYNAYKYGIVINFNINPIIPGKGSAIFLHCNIDTYTAGCISVNEDDMITLIKVLDKNKSPHILIL